MNRKEALAIEYTSSHPECQKDDSYFDAWCDKAIEEMEIEPDKEDMQEDTHGNI